jgi:quercetin dioxygenase-like cupin family protein
MARRHLLPAGRGPWVKEMSMAITTRYVLVSILALAPGAASVVLAQVAAKEPPAAPITFPKGVRSSNPRAATPQFAAIATGLYARTIVDTQSSKGDYKIRVWSLSVSPKATTGDVTLPGAAMLSLTAGAVEYVAGEQRGKLQPGDTAAIPEGASLRFVNDDTRAAVLRAVIVSSR